MKDFLNQELELGDFVCVTGWGSKQSLGLKQVVGFSDKQVQTIPYTGQASGYNGRLFYDWYYPESVVKVEL